MERRHPFAQLVLARFREFYREPEALFWVYGFPLILVSILGLAFSGNKPEPPAVDILGSETTPAVKTLQEQLAKADFKVEIHDLEDCQRRLRIGQSALYLVPDSPTPQYNYDPSRSDSLLARYWAEAVLNRRGEKNEQIVTEPGSRYIDFLFPGLVGMNLMGGGLFGVGFVLVDMRVRKLFKRLMATPVRPSYFLASILSARMIFLVPEMLSLFFIGRVLYGVPQYGSYLALIVVIVLGAVAFAGIGLLIASRTSKSETASGLISLVMMPSYLLSGVFFSAKRFPEATQPFIQALPLTQVNDALREVMLEGKDLTEIGTRLAILAAWAVVTFCLALWWFKWR